MTMICRFYLVILFYYAINALNEEASLDSQVLASFETNLRTVKAPSGNQPAC